MTGNAKQDEAALKEAAAMIRAGEVVAFPTETVYGLGANAFDGAAVRKIYQAKGRPSWNPLITHVSSKEMMDPLVLSYPSGFDKLAQAFMPGPLTILAKKTRLIAEEVRPGVDTVALRMPKHDIALKFISACGVPVAAPSANRSGHTSPTTAQHVLDDLDGRIAAVIDGGPCEVGVESTVIDLTQDPPMILRPGGITKEQIESVLGREVAVFTSAAEGSEGKGLLSPGMLSRHYAPNTKLINLGETPAELWPIVRELVSQGKKVGVLLPSDWSWPEDISAERVIAYDYGKWGDWAAMAQRVFNALRWLDKQGIDVMVGPLPPARGVGLALRDRLIRAAK